MAKKHDSFLIDAIKTKDRPPKLHQLGYMDGFRFGTGFFTAGLLLTIILAGLTWGIILAVGLR